MYCQSSKKYHSEGNKQKEKSKWGQMPPVLSYTRDNEDYTCINIIILASIHVATMSRGRRLLKRHLSLLRQLSIIDTWKKSNNVKYSVFIWHFFLKLDEILWCSFITLSNCYMSDMGDKLLQFLFYYQSATSKQSRNTLLCSYQY